jgi:hypothetical protein
MPGHTPEACTVLRQRIQLYRAGRQLSYRQKFLQWFVSALKNISGNVPSERNENETRIYIKIITPGGSMAYSWRVSKS